MQFTELVDQIYLKQFDLGKIFSQCNSNGKAKINLINMQLVKIGIQTKIFLADSIYKTCHKWAINNFTKCNNNNLIIWLMINIGAKSATHKKNSLSFAIVK